MTEQDESGHEKTLRDHGLRLKRLFCKRTGEQIELSEHERCPYCQGRMADIETGKHEAFCDYHEGVDPVHYGFPEHERRLEEG